MRRLVVLALAFGAACATSGRSLPRALDEAPTIDPADPDIQLLTRLQLTIAAAIAPLDSVALDSLIAPDVRMINAGDQVFGKADIVRFLRANGGPLVRVTDDSIAVRRYGDTAVMTMRESVLVRANGAESTGRLRITEVWLRRNGRWQVVGGQSTALP
jgi:uncharacterized protein (TIGR02246 family)